MEPFLPFSHNLLYKRLRFDDKLDLIESILPLDEKTCFMFDISWNYHIKSYSPEDEEYASQQFPIPSYANNRNPNVLYSVDYLDLYRYIYPKVNTYHFDGEKLQYAQLILLRNCRIAIQFDSFNPVAIIDLHRPNDPPVLLQDVSGVESLHAAGDFLVWYDGKTEMVFLYHEGLKKRKALNFSKIKVESFESVKDHVIIAVSRRNLEILDYSKNKKIKSVGFLDEDETPKVLVHFEGNVISYIAEKHIYVCKTEKGKIKWESKYDLHDYATDSTYAFLAHNLIALEAQDAIHILSLDSHSFSLVSKMQHPWLGFVETPDLTILCCEGAQKRGLIMGIFPLWGNRFTVLETVCQTQALWHGHQRVSLFSWTNLIPEDIPQRARLSVKKSILFEEYRDSVRAIDVLDETMAMFITEKGKIFEVNLKDHSIEYAVELSGLVRKCSHGQEKIEKFFALSENKVVIATKKECSPHVRIAIFSLKTRCLDWDSIEFKEVGEEEDQILFYDVIKLSPDRIFVTYLRNDGNDSRYLVGELSREDYEGECWYSIRDFRPETGVAFDRLWSLDSSSLVAMRHKSNVFDLSLMNAHEESYKVKHIFSAEKHLPRAHMSSKGILDVRFLRKDVAYIQLKMKGPEFIVFVYDFQTEQLRSQIQTDYIFVGTIRRCYRENNILRSMEKMIVFGYSGTAGSCLHFESEQKITTKRFNYIWTEGDDQNLKISSRNFQLILGRRENQALVYENDCHKNFICLVKSPNWKLESLRILQKAIGNHYHKYIYKNIVDTIFGVI